MTTRPRPLTILLSALLLLFLSPACNKNTDSSAKAPPPKPHIDNLDPATVPFNWTGTVKVNGDHFHKDCTMLGFRGSPKVRYVSKTLLEVDVTTATTDQAGAQTVKAHALNTGDISNDKAFTVEPAKPKSR